MTPERRSLQDEDVAIAAAIHQHFASKSTRAPSHSVQVLVPQVRSKALELAHGNPIQFDEQTIREAVNHLLLRFDDAEGNIKIATPTDELQDDIGNRW